MAAFYNHPVYGERFMGKGDRKSTKGKIWRGSYGNTRPHRAAQKKVAAKSAGIPARKKKK
jgi:30S ribosomal protein S31